MSLTDKKRLVKAFEECEEYVLLGRQLSYCESTVRNIIHKFEKIGLLTKSKRGGSKSKLTKDLKEFLLENLNSNPFLTINEMITILNVEKRESCSTGTMSTWIHKQLISFKIARRSFVEKNSLKVRLLRKQYIERFLEEKWQMCQTIYIDECGFNLWMHAKRCWKKVGERLNIPLPNNRGPNISLVMAIGKYGPIHYEL